MNHNTYKSFFTELKKLALDPQEYQPEVKPVTEQVRAVLGKYNKEKKAGAPVSEDQAVASLKRLHSLEQSKPTAGQVGRYAGIGAVAAPAVSMMTNAVRGKPIMDAGTASQKLREVAGRAAGGAITSGAIPLVRSHLDRKAEIGTLKNYLNQQQGV